MARCQPALGMAPFPTKWMIHTYRLGYVSQQYKLTYILTHAPAPEPASYFPRKKDGEEAELNGHHPALREGDEGTSSRHWAATDEHMHVAHTAAWKQTARAGLEKEEGKICCFTLVIEKLKKMVG